MPNERQGNDCTYNKAVRGLNRTIRNAPPTQPLYSRHSLAPSGFSAHVEWMLFLQLLPGAKFDSYSSSGPLEPFSLSCILCSNLSSSSLSSRSASSLCFSARTFSSSACKAAMPSSSSSVIICSCPVALVDGEARLGILFLWMRVAEEVSVGAS